MKFLGWYRFSKLAGIIRNPCYKFYEIKSYIMVSNLFFISTPNLRLDVKGNIYGDSNNLVFIWYRKRSGCFQQRTEWLWLVCPWSPTWAIRFHSCSCSS